MRTPAALSGARRGVLHHRRCVAVVPGLLALGLILTEANSFVFGQEPQEGESKGESVPPVEKPLEKPVEKGEPAPPSEPEAEPTAAPILVLQAKRVIVAPGEVLENASVIVQNGRIIAVGQGLAVPEGAEVLAGEVVCAGYIDPWSRLGVDDRSLNDSRTAGDSRAVDALDPWGNEHERTLAVRAGVLAVRAQAGDTSDIGGIGAIVRTGVAGEHLVLLADSNVGATVGISDRRPKDPFDRIGEADRLVTKLIGARDYRVEWAEYTKQLAEWEKKVAERLAELEKDFKKAQKARDKDIEDAKKKGEEHQEKPYKEDKELKPPRKPRFDAEKEILARVAAGELPLFVRCEGLAELRALLIGTEPLTRLRMIIVGGSGAEQVGRELAQRHIPVVVNPMPYGDTDGSRPEGNDLGLASRLHALGVEVLLGSGRAATHDLPVLAALSVGHGLDQKDAFHALTLGAAQALDVADQLGTVRVGKRADLLLLDAEPLSNGARVRAAISAGRVVHESPAR